MLKIKKSIPKIILNKYEQEIEDNLEKTQQLSKDDEAKEKITAKDAASSFKGAR